MNIARIAEERVDPTSDLQRQIEELLMMYECGVPNRWFAYGRGIPPMGRGEFVQRVLLAAHIYGMTLAVEMNKKLAASISRPIIIVTSEEAAEKLRKEIKEKEIPT